MMQFNQSAENMQSDDNPSGNRRRTSNSVKGYLAVIDPQRQWGEGLPRY